MDIYIHGYYLYIGSFAIPAHTTLLAQELALEQIREGVAETLRKGAIPYGRERSVVENGIRPGFEPSRIPNGYPVLVHALRGP